MEGYSTVVPSSGIFKGIPLKYHQQLAKNLRDERNRASAFWEDQIFTMSKSEEDDQPNQDQIYKLAKVAIKMAEEGVLDLKRHKRINLEHKYFFSNIATVIVGDNVGLIDPRLSREEFVEKINQKITQSFKQREMPSKLLSVFRRVLKIMIMPIAYSIPEGYKPWKALKTYRPWRNLAHITDKYFKKNETVAEFKLNTTRISCKTLRTLFTLSPEFKDDFFKVLNGDEIIKDVEADAMIRFSRMMKACKIAFSNNPDATEPCLSCCLPETKADTKAIIDYLNKRLQGSGVPTELDENLTRASSSITNVISKKSRLSWL